MTLAENEKIVKSYEYCHVSKINEKRSLTITDERVVSIYKSRRSFSCKELYLKDVAGVDASIMQVKRLGLCFFLLFLSLIPFALSFVFANFRWMLIGVGGVLLGISILAGIFGRRDVAVKVILLTYRAYADAMTVASSSFVENNKRFNRHRLPTVSNNLVITVHPETALQMVEEIGALIVDYQKKIRNPQPAQAETKVNEEKPKDDIPPSDSPVIPEKPSEPEIPTEEKTEEKEETKKEKHKKEKKEKPPKEKKEKHKKEKKDKRSDDKDE